jgi:HD superfamily phosphohydrolase
MNEYVINEDEIKVIKDPIYGYIEIPVEYFLFFIDTSIFQRLRRIEQTGARVLYPAAHHDRFVHSLGVFHLGKLAFQNLKRNSFNLLNETQWKKYQKTFEIACLLHDCGHAPFSHTFEEYFVLGSKISEINTRFLKFFDENFLIELNESGAVPH